MSFLSEFDMFSDAAVLVAFLCNYRYSVILDWKLNNGPGAGESRL